MTDRQVSAIVLAGGRSSRFGRDKLAEPLEGRPLLQHAIDNVRPFARELLVVVSPDATPDLPPDVLVVRDRARFEGPLAGLRDGLGAARESVVLVTAGDMPDAVAEVIEALLGSLDAAGAEAAVLEHEGRPRPLPMALCRVSARAVAIRLVEAGERRLGALTDALVTTVIDESAWRVLDPAGRTLHDVDTPADLR